MVINKIPGRIMLRQRAQFGGTVFLIFLAVLTYTMFVVLVDNVDKNYENFKEKYAQETLHFLTARPVDYELLGRKYGFAIEERLIFDVAEEKITYRIIGYTGREKINKPYLSGKKPASGEVYLDPQFASVHGLKKGDEITIGGKKFRVAGTFALPDYIYIIKNDGDFLPQPERFGLVLMPVESANRIGVPQFRYYCARGDGDFEGLKRELTRTGFLLGVQTAPENPRISYAEIKIKNIRDVTVKLPVIIFVVASLLLFIVLRRLIKTMQREVGTLYALGYTRAEVIRAFLRFPFYLWGLGAVTGVMAGYLLAIPVTRYYLTYFNIPSLIIAFPYQVMAKALFFPLLFLIPATLLATWQRGGGSVLALIKGQVGDTGRRVRLRLPDGLSFPLRVAVRYGLGNLLRGSVLVVGIAVAASLLAYGLVAKDAVATMVDKTFKETFVFRYQYLLSEFVTKPAPAEVEPFLLLPMETNKGKTVVQLMGVNPSSRMINIKREDGEKIEVRGLVVSRALAEKLGIEKGERVTLTGKLDGRKLTATVQDVADIRVGSYAFLPREEFTRLFKLPAGSYNGFWAERKPDTVPGKVLAVFDKVEMMDSFAASIQPLYASIVILGTIAVLFSLAIIYVLSNLILQENRFAIGILKILGWRDRDVNYMVLGSNDALFLVGFLVGIPSFNALVDYLMKEAMKDVDFSISLSASPTTWVITFFVLLATWLLGRYLNHRKIAGVYPTEILKEQID